MAPEAMTEGETKEQGPRPLSEIRSEKRAMLDKSAQRLENGFKRFAASARERVLDVGAFVLTGPEMGRRAAARMKEVGEQNTKAREEVMAAFGKEGRAVAIKLGREKLDQAKKVVGEFAAENWHWSKRNKEKRQTAAELAANKARYMELTRDIAGLEAAEAELRQQRAEAVAQKMELKALLGSVADQLEQQAAQEEAETVPAEGVQEAA